jgi:DNA replication protein DnaC
MDTIETQLRQLKLNGMADSLSSRIQEASSNQLPFEEFLALLAQDEKLHRDQKRYESRYKKACFKGHKTLENFDFNFNPKIKQSMITEISTCNFIKERAPVLLVGPCGIGKSHISQAIGHCALQKGFTVLCTTQSKLSDELQAAKATNSYQRKIKNLSKFDLLIIDDFGLKPLRCPEDENLHELIAERYEQSSTMITSNLALEEWQQAFANKLLGVATIDRLKHNAYYLDLDGETYRSIKKKQS